MAEHSASAKKMNSVSSAASAEHPSKRRRKGNDGDSAQRSEPGLQPLAPGLAVTLESTKDCVHEVAVPSGYPYVPMSETSLPAKMAKEYPFTLDPFQKEAIKCIERRESVLVSAHTSAGKTVVAEYAIATSLHNSQRVIYTSPIKALSNQKYRELQEEFSDVGLMTGDVTINPSATCLVMTTEILRSMLYRGSEVMREVGWVVFDEVHYMRDKERGVVWEEVMILLPDNVHYVFLSATIPNALQFAKWICDLHKQPCHVVYTEYRPTPLQHYLFPVGGDGLHLVVDERGGFREDNFARAMAALGDGAEGEKKAKKKGGKAQSEDCGKIVKLMMTKGCSPVIVFSFGKRACEQFAQQLSKNDFNTETEATLVGQIFSNAIDSLSDEDKKLPQIENILPLLKRGIGIHHGGLLPIIKEVIEILFAESLVKVLFATETFAMGLNMPAKTVVFTNARKFDGKDHRWVTSGEYIQMSGRAGRRGLDDRGLVVLMCDEKMEPPVGKSLLKGSADKLNSAFHLTYNMVLNLLRVEEINPEYMLERSFFQFQNQQALPNLRAKLESEIADQSAIRIPQMEASMEYFGIRKQLQRLAAELQAVVVKPNYVLPFLNPGRLVHVVDPSRGGVDWGWGVIVNFKKTGRGSGSNGAGTEEHIYVVEVLLSCSAAATIEHPSNSGELCEMRVVPVLLELLHSISTLRIFLPADLRPADSRKTVEKSVTEVKKRFPDGLPLLDPVEDMKIPASELSTLVSRTEALEKRLAAHPLHGAKDTPNSMELCQRRLELADVAAKTRKEIKLAQSVLQLDELRCRKRVLRRLDFTTADDVITLKGRVACEISTGDSLVLTELIFNGAFSDLDVDHCVALVTCFVFDENSDDPPKPPAPLASALRVLQDTARRVAKVCVESKLQVDEEEYVKGFKTEMMQIGFAWAGGATFSEVCKMTDIFEGSIIRVMRRLEELLRQLCMAAKAIGNTELENKFATGITKIKRDIVFAASLYL